MQQILGYMRRAITEYGMLEDGDKVAVGVSGGKDSLVLLTGLARLREFIGIRYDVVAVTLDPQFGGISTDYSPVEELCGGLGVPYIVKQTEIGPIVFDYRKEKNPCSLCARMRRGALHDAALAQGCNKVALGHHRDDAVETFFLNLFHEGRLGSFSPVTYLSRKNLHLIRPLIFAPEKLVRSAARRNGMPVVKSKCPVDGHTSREEIKQWIAQKERENRGFQDLIFGAMRRGDLDGLGGLLAAKKQ